MTNDAIIKDIKTVDGVPLSEVVLPVYIIADNDVWVCDKLTIELRLTGCSGSGFVRSYETVLAVAEGRSSRHVYQHKHEALLQLSVQLTEAATAAVEKATRAQTGVSRDD